MIKIRRLGVK